MTATRRDSIMDEGMPTRHRRMAKALVLLLLWNNIALSPDRLGGPRITAGKAEAAGLVADPNAALAFRPGIGTSAGGVPSVNIARPNQAGLSLNQYRQFDVSPQGVILNNSLLGGGSLIGGAVAANPNLAGGMPALTIINEVTVAGAPGRLEGTIEVFGAPAGVIVANPNGMTCAGCGVINTPRLTLTTGRPFATGSTGEASRFDTAAGLAYDIRGGHIRIEGAGIEGTVGRIDLLADSLDIHGPLRAHYLNGDLSSINLTTGQGLVAEAPDGAWANRQPASGVPTAVGYAIDASLLGAMTAGQIRIVATAAGMGVNLRAPLVAHQRDIQIDAAGNLALARLAAVEDIRLDADGNLSVARDFLAGGKIDAQAGGSMDLGGPISSGGDMRLTSGVAMNVAGDLQSGGDFVARSVGDMRLGGAAARIAVAGDAQLDARNLDLAGHTVVTGGMIAHAAGDASYSGQLVVGQDAVLDAAHHLSMHGETQVNRDLGLHAGSVAIQADVTVGHDYRIASTGDVDITGETRAGHLFHIAGGTVNLGGGLSSPAIEVEADRLELSGDGLSVDGNLGLNLAGALNVTGPLSVSGNASIGTGGDQRFASDVAAGGYLALDAGGGLNVAGSIRSGGDALLAARQGLNVGAGIDASGHLFIRTDSDATVSGAVRAGARFVAEAGGSLDLGGTLTAGSGMRLVAGQDVLVAGDVTAGALTVRADDAEFAGAIAVGGDSDYSVGALRVAGTMQSGGNLDIEAGGGGVSAHRILGDRDVLIRSQSGIRLDDVSAVRDIGLDAAQGNVEAGGLIAGRDQTLRAQGDIDAGTVVAGRNAVFESLTGGLTLGPLLAGGSIDSLAARTVTLTGLVQGEGSVALASGDVLAVTGPVQAGGALAMSGLGIDLGDDVFAAGSASLNAGTGALTVAGALLSGSDAILAGEGIRVEGIQSLGDLDVDAGVGDYVNAGDTLVGGAYRASAGGRHDAAGRMRVQGDATLRSDNDARIAGPVEIGGGYDAQSGGELRHGAETLILGDARLAAAGRQSLEGPLRVGGHIQADAGGDMRIDGALLANGPVSLNAASGGIAIAGDLASGGNASLDAESDIEIQGNVWLNAGSFVGRQGGVTIGGDTEALGAFNLVARDDILLDGTVRVGDALTAASQNGDIVFGDDISVPGDLAAHAGGNLRFLGDSILLGETDIGAGGTLENGGRMVLGGSLVVDTHGDFVNEGSIEVPGDFRVHARNIRSNQARSGGIVATASMTAVADSTVALGSLGEWTAGEGLDLAASHGMSNAGTLRTGGQLTYAGGLFGNSGAVAASSIDIASDVSNQGSLYADAIHVGGHTGNVGSIVGGAVQLAGLDNGGTVGGDSLVLGYVGNGGLIRGQVIDIMGGLDNVGTVAAAVALNVAGGVANSGDIFGNGIQIQGGQLINGGRLQSGGAMAIQVGVLSNNLAQSRRCVAGSAICNQQPGVRPLREDDYRWTLTPGSIVAAGDLTIGADSLSNEGIVEAGGSLHATVGGGFVNTRSENDLFTDSNHGNANPTAGSGVVRAGGNLSIQAGGIQNVGGELHAGNGIDLWTSGDFVNAAPRPELAGSVIGSHVRIEAIGVDNQGAIQAKNGSVVIRSGADFANEGAAARIVGQSEVDIVAGGAIGNGAGASILAGQWLSLDGASIDNAGILYGNGGPVARMRIRSGGGFDNAGTAIAGQDLVIQASTYDNHGTVGSFGDATLTLPGTWAAAGDPLIAKGTLRLNVSGISVGRAESWASDAALVAWSGTLENSGAVSLDAAQGDVVNHYTGQTQKSGAPTADGTYLLTSGPIDTPVDSIGWHVVAYEDVAQRAYFGAGAFSGSLFNYASDAAIGGGVYTPGFVDQTVYWEGEVTEYTEEIGPGGEILLTPNTYTVYATGTGQSLPRLVAGGGASITLIGPNPGTIVGGNLALNGVDLVLPGSIDPGAGPGQVALAQNTQVTPGNAATPDDATPVGGQIMADAGPQAPDGADLPDAGDADTPVGSGQAGGIPGGIGGGADVAERQLALPTPNLADPQAAVAALLAGNTRVARPAWDQMRIAPGGITADSLVLNLSGKLVNRGVLDVTHELILRAAQGIDNFGAAIHAGGGAWVRTGDLDNRQGSLQARSLYAELDGDLDNNGGLIRASEWADIQIGGDLIATRGRFLADAGQLYLSAAGDIDLQAGEVKGSGGVTLVAGRDLRLGTVTETRTETTQAGARTTVTTTTRQIGTEIDAGGGPLALVAGGQAEMTAVRLKSGADLLIAGQDVVIQAGKDRTDVDANEAGKRYRYSHQSTHETLAGGTVEAEGSVSVVADRDITLAGAMLRAETSRTTMAAGGNVNLDTVETEHSEYTEEWKKKKGFLSSKTTHILQQGQSTLAEGSHIEGAAVDITAGGDLSATGAVLLADGGVNLKAGGDLRLEAGENRTRADSYSQVKKSGLFSGGGLLGITLGSQKTTTDRRNESTQAVGTRVGSLHGDIAIQAGGAYAQTGSDVLAPEGDIAVQATSIAITEAREIERDQLEQRFKQSGISLGLTGAAVSAAQTVVRMGEALTRTDSPRMQAMALATGALAGKNTYDALTNPAPGTDPVSLTLSIGTSKSQSTRLTERDSAKGSHIAAGGDVSLVAEGARADSDLLIRGSTVSAGGDARLKAGGDLHLEAAHEALREQGRNKSSSASLGVSLGSQTGVTVSASQGRGEHQGEDLTWSPTRVMAGNTLSLESGGDTTLKGATAQGETLVARVGGDLAIQSLQDQSTYAGKQKNSGFSLTVGPAGMPTGGSLSAGKSEIDSDYRSVSEQSGLKAGDGGFDVQVQGDTALTGGVIASRQSAVDQDINHFQSDDLVMTDIANRAEYEAIGASVSIGTGVSLDGKLAPQGTSAGVGEDSGRAASMTLAAISNVAGNRAVRTGDSGTGIKPIFDAGKVQREISAQVTITQAFGQQASQAIGDYAATKLMEAQALRAHGREQEAMDIESLWGASGTLRLAAHTVIGGLTGGLPGAAGAAAGMLTVSAVAESLRSAGIDDPLATVIIGLARTAAGAGVGSISGATAALNEAANNYLSHSENQLREDAASKCAGGDPQACAARDYWDSVDRQRDDEFHAACDGQSASADCKAATSILHDEYLATYGGPMIGMRNPDTITNTLGSYADRNELQSYVPLINISDQSVFNAIPDPTQSQRPDLYNSDRYGVIANNTNGLYVIVKIDDRWLTVGSTPQVMTDYGGLNGIQNPPEYAPGLIGNHVNTVNPNVGLYTLYYTPTDGFFSDGWKVYMDKLGFTTTDSLNFSAVLGDVQAGGRDVTWVAHSRGGVTFVEGARNIKGDLSRNWVLFHAGANNQIVTNTILAERGITLGDAWWKTNPNEDIRPYLDSQFDAVPNIVGMNGNPLQILGSVVASPLLFLGPVWSPHTLAPKPIAPSTPPTNQPEPSQP